MKRSRDLRNRDLNGTNIKVIQRSGYESYYYKMPGGTLEPLGTNRKDAIEAAMILNQHLRPAGNIAATIINRQGKAKLNQAPKPLDSLDKLLTKYETKYLPEKGNAARTSEEKTYKLNQYRAKWGERSTASITTNEIAEFLDELSAHAYIKHRSLLEDLFGYAIHQGLRQDNPVSVTIAKKPPARTRRKHTLEGYQKIHAISPEWLKRAIDIALRSLQRRGDLYSLHRDQIDQQAGTIEILQHKSRNYKTPVYIKIQMGKELSDAVNACLNSGISCPYLIHYRPRRITKDIREAKLHPFAVTDAYLTKQFAKYRDQSGAYDHIPKNLRPSFHDLRGLGSYLYEKAGFPKSYIQALTGHASTAMLDHYIQGHEDPMPVIVSAELSINTTRIRVDE